MKNLGPEKTPPAEGKNRKVLEVFVSGGPGSKKEIGTRKNWNPNLLPNVS